MPVRLPKLDRIAGASASSARPTGRGSHHTASTSPKSPRTPLPGANSGPSILDQETLMPTQIEALKKSVAMMPKSNDCLTMLGESYMKNGDSRSAIGPLERSRQLVKSDIRVLSRLAECYRPQATGKSFSPWSRTGPCSIRRTALPRNELAEMDIKDQRKWRDAIPHWKSRLSSTAPVPRTHLLFAKACEKTNNENGRIAT